jgi:hypothetical protein
MISAAWNAFLDEKKDVAVKDIKPKMSKNSGGKLCILTDDMPRCGGLDVARAAITVEDVSGKDDGKASETGAGKGKGKRKGPNAAAPVFAVGDKVSVKPPTATPDEFVEYTGTVNLIGKDGYLEIADDVDGEIYGCETKVDIVTKVAADAA